MTDFERNADVSKTLTEQWKARELQGGWYWVKGNRAEGVYAYTAEYLNNMYRPRNSEKIIEQVPSYEEWQAKDKENQQLKERNDSLNSRDINLCRIANGIRDENFALKELLKECRYKIIADLDKARLCESSVDIEDFEYLLNRIDNAIGDK